MPRGKRFPNGCGPIVSGAAVRPPRPEILIDKSRASPFSKITRPKNNCPRMFRPAVSGRLPASSPPPRAYQNRGAAKASKYGSVHPKGLHHTTPGQKAPQARAFPSTLPGAVVLAAGSGMQGTRTPRSLSYSCPSTLRNRHGLENFLHTPPGKARNTFAEFPRGCLMDSTGIRWGGRRGVGAGTATPRSAVGLVFLPPASLLKARETWGSKGKCGGFPGQRQGVKPEKLSHAGSFKKCVRELRLVRQGSSHTP